jgi:hypothetical protein
VRDGIPSRASLPLPGFARLTVYFAAFRVRFLFSLQLTSAFLSAAPFDARWCSRTYSAGRACPPLMGGHKNRTAAVRCRSGYMSSSLLSLDSGRRKGRDARGRPVQVRESKGDRNTRACPVPDEVTTDHHTPCTQPRRARPGEHRRERTDKTREDSYLDRAPGSLAR